MKKKYAGNKINRKVRDLFHYTGKYIGTAHKVCNLRYSIPKKIPTVFHSGSNYLIITELSKEFKGEFSCPGENTEKYLISSVPIKK